MKRSDIVIDRIIRCELDSQFYAQVSTSQNVVVTIQTGLLTVVVAILDIIFYLTNVSDPD